MSQSRKDFLNNIDAAIQILKVARDESSRIEAIFHYTPSITLLTEFKDQIPDLNKQANFKQTLEIFTRYFFGTAIYAMRDRYEEVEKQYIENTAKNGQPLSELNPYFKGRSQAPEGYHASILRVGDAYLKGEIAFRFDKKKNPSFSMMNEKLLSYFTKPQQPIALAAAAQAAPVIVIEPAPIAARTPIQPIIAPPAAALELTPNRTLPLRRQPPIPRTPSPAALSPIRPAFNPHKHRETPAVTAQPGFFEQYKWDILAGILGIGLIVAGAFTGGLVLLTGTALFTFSKILSLSTFFLGAAIVTGITAKNTLSSEPKPASSTRHIAKSLNMNVSLPNQIGDEPPKHEDFPAYQPWVPPSTPAPTPPQYDSKRGASYCV